MITIGIDPGVFGAIVTLENGKLTGAVRMPDAVGEIAHLLRLACDVADVTVAIEAQSAMPRQGRTSIASQMRRYGELLGIVATLGVPLRVLQPAQWRRMAGLPTGSGKAAAIAEAERRYGLGVWVRGWPAASREGAADAALVAGVTSGLVDR